MEFDYVRLRGIITAAGVTPFKALEHSENLGNNMNWDIAPYNGSTPILGLGPDLLLCPDAFPYTIKTDGFFASPLASFTWNDGSTLETLTITDPGTYSVTVSYPDGCSRTDNVIITRSDVPVAALTGTTAVCTGRTTTLSSATTGGVWSTSDAAVATVSTTGVVTGVTPGSVTITYTITNSNGCSASQDATITVNAVPVVADITGTLSVFQGSTTALTSTTAGGVWSSSNTAIASVSNTGVVSGVAPGTATVTYTVTSPQGCDAAKTAIVTVDGFTADKRVLSLTKTADAAEPTTNGSFALRLPSGVLAEENITINYTVTGTAGMADYAALSGTATIPAGQNGVNLPVTVTDDALVEITETVIVTLNSATGVKYTYTLSPTDNNATVNITDDENTPAKRTLSVANAGNAVEGGAAGKFRISLPAGVNTSEDITVTYTISGTATNGTDYTTLGGSIVIPAGLSGVDVTVTTINDQIIEGNETVILTLTGGTTASIGAFTGTASATVNIADNDNTAANRTLLVSNIQNAAEPSSNGSFTIGLPAGVTVTEAINVNYAVTGTALSGVDYTALSGVVTIPAGQNSVTIPILVIDDALVELTETVVITLQNSSSASFNFTPATTGGSGTVNIADDDNIAANRVISITKKTDAAEPAASGAFHIGLPTGIIASENITVAYTVSGTATPGADYVVLPATAVIPAGSNGIDLPVNVIDDTEIESTETVGLSLNSASAANLTYTISITQNAATVDIADDDFAGNSNVVLLTKVSDAVEGGVQGQYRISLKPGVTSSQDITVSFSLGGSAISGTDYTLTGLTGGNIVIPAGANEVLINVNAVDDGVVEGPEEVLLTLIGAASASYPFVVDPASNSATVNVIDANASNSTPIEVIGGVVNASEPSTPGSFTVKLAGSATAAWPVTVGYALSGTAVSGLDYEALGTIVIPANTNSVTVALNILDDKIIEPVETAIFTLLSGSAIAGAAPAYIFPADATNNQVTINIADDDQAAGNRVLTVVKTTDGTEPATGGVYTVSLPAGYTSSTPITLNYSMVGTATRNTDYTISGTTLPANRNSVTIPVPVIDDQIIEGTEVLSMRMGNSTDANGFIYTVDPATTEVSMNITDDDTDPAKLQLAVTNSGNAAEPATNGEFTISLPTGVTAAIDITVNYTVSGTATPGSDYVALPATLTIPAGQNSITVPVTVSDDQLIENTETVILAITGGTAGSLNLTPASGSSSAIVNITDDENTAANTVIGIAAGTNATEGTADVSSFTISLPMNILTPEAITVTYTIGGTATNGADYTLLSGTAVIPAGQNSVVVSTPATDDDIIETDESIILTLTGATSNGFSWTIHLTANEATTLIIDNDNTAANLALTIVNVTDAAEPATNGMFRLSLPTGKTVAEDVTVNYAVTGTATAGTDYTALTGSVVVPAGQSGVNIPVTVIDDQVVEPAETVILTINGGASTSFTFTGTGNATVNIADDESSVPANLALTISNTTDAAEPLTNGSFSIDLPAGITIMEDVTVAYTVTGTATAGTDYTVLSGTAVIPAGQSSVSIPVTVIDDQLVEQTETVVATLNGGSSTSFTFTGTGSATVNITDDESAGSLTLAISKTADGAEPATNGGFEISLPAGVISSEDITVHYAVSGTATRNADYTALSGTVVIPAGQNSATIPVDVLDDTIIEAVETVIVTLNGGSSANFTFSGTGSATVNIADNDNTAANLVLTITKLNDAAEPSTAGRVSIALPAGVTAAESVTVTYNVAGNASPDVDYAALSGTVIIPAGENSVMVPVSVIDDQVIETTETVILALNGGTSTNFAFTATGSVTVNIADDDNVPANLVLNAAVNIAAAEPDVPGSFTVALPAGITATEDITVSYAVGGTATADEDYSSLTGIAVIPAGSNNVDVMVNILDDKLIEGSETLTLEITGGLSTSLAFAPGPDKKQRWILPMTMPILLI
ncbi:Ig-like domain-containing protein [Chitinophaga sedimenti]|uniref:Calx-beta domain-containing protein n=1 Tax=Chitinophaga sedimenti TaxID=2033606 RepID=UPI0020052AEC|nr:Calx-beta domain-containing protein [Chitinophaga sedimenti]MCK7554698.1 Ig-like domain-containing protein [Chitinophaga sedimenti]